MITWKLASKCTYSTLEYICRISPSCSRGLIMNTHLPGELKRGLFNNKSFWTCFSLRSVTSVKILSSLNWQKVVIQHPGRNDHVKTPVSASPTSLYRWKYKRQIIYEIDHHTGPRLSHGYLVSHAVRQHKVINGPINECHSIVDATAVSREAGWWVLYSVSHAQAIWHHQGLI